jgi:site-specific recombinase XerD
VDFNLGGIHIRKAKNTTRQREGKSRSVPLTDRARNTLWELCCKDDGPWVWTNPDTGEPFTDVKKSFRAACDKAKIEDFTFHDLRHTFGTRLADRGADVVKIKELMGHADIQTTMRYTHVTDVGKREAIAKLSQYSAADASKSEAQPNASPLEQLMSLQLANAEQIKALVEAQARTDEQIRLLIDRIGGTTR